MNHITNKKIDEYLPVIAHYYDLDKELAARNKSILRILLVLIFSIEIKFKMHDIDISSKKLKDQLRSLFIRRAYSKEKRESWSFPSHVDEKTFYNFMSRYFKITTVYYPESPAGYYYFKWIYDAFNVYASSVSHHPHVLAEEFLPVLQGA